MIDAFKMLYKIRMDNLLTEGDIRRFIKSELMDEYTHPRVRQNLEKKYQLAVDRVKNSKLSHSEKNDILTVINEEFIKLSSASEI